jgi:hypothetical protein
VAKEYFDNAKVAIDRLIDTKVQLHQNKAVLEEKLDTLK